MAKISDYSKVTELTNDNVFIIDGQNGTKGILANELAKGLNDSVTPMDITGLDFNELGLNNYLDQTSIPIIQPDTGDGNTLYRVGADDIILKTIVNIETSTRRNTWRGKNLGSSVTDEQYNQIKAGTFKDLFLGDYWNINDVTWRIVDFDYWMNTGDTSCTTHHLVIMPDKNLHNASMNGGDTTSGGYLGSGMRADKTRNTTKQIIIGAFGENNLLNHREYLTNAVTNGYPSGGAWVDSTFELPNEIMIYGNNSYLPSGNGTITPYNFTIDKTQLAGMRINPDLIGPHSNNDCYWLRDVINQYDFLVVRGGYRTHDHAGAHVTWGVRPVFGIIG